LGDWRWDRLRSLSGGNCDTTCNDGSGGDAEASTGNEVAAGDDRSSSFFGLLGFDWLGRLLAC
jgi:hypothetical protein